MILNEFFNLPQVFEKDMEEGIFDKKKPAEPFEFYLDGCDPHAVKKYLLNKFGSQGWRVAGPGAGTSRVFVAMSPELYPTGNEAKWDIESNCGEQGVAEGEGNLSKALDTLSGSWSGWHQVKSRNPDIEKFEWDDGEGGFYAGGSIEHNLKTGEVTVDYHGEYDDEVKGTFKNMGDAMRALRGDGGSHGGRAPNFDRLRDRKPPGPDDLRKTDRTGRKGTIGGGYANQLKGSIQANKGRLGPKGVLPEQGMAEAKDDYVPPREANYDDKYQAMVRRVGEKARAQEKARQQQQPKAPVRESRLALLRQIIQS